MMIPSGVRRLRPAKDPTAQITKPKDQKSSRRRDACQNKKGLDALDADLKAGRISQEECLRRKKEIQERSLVY